MAIRRILIDEDDIDNITTLLNSMPYSASFHSTSSYNVPDQVHYDFNITDQSDMPSIFKNISSTATYCRDHGWAEPPIKSAPTESDGPPIPPA